MALYTVQEDLQMRAARIAAQEASEASKKQRNPVMSSTISQCPPRHSPDNQTRMEYVFGVLVYLSKARDQDGELTKHIIRGITYSASLAVIERKRPFRIVCMTKLFALVGWNKLLIVCVFDF